MQGVLAVGRAFAVLRRGNAVNMYEARVEQVSRYCLFCVVIHSQMQAGHRRYGWIGVF